MARPKKIIPPTTTGKEFIEPNHQPAEKRESDFEEPEQLQESTLIEEVKEPIVLASPTIEGKIMPSNATIEAPKQTAYVGQKIIGNSDVVKLRNRVGMITDHPKKEAERMLKLNPDCYTIVN